MRKCKKCKCEKVNHGEKKKFLIWSWWVWWCDKCYKKRFCKAIESNSILLEKYYDIYGDKPSNIIFK